MTKLFQTCTFIILYFLLFGCDQDKGNPLDVLLEDNTEKYYRDFIYDQNILIENNLNTNDFKKIYTKAEIIKILGDSINISKHQSLILEYDLCYVNIYGLVYSSFEIIVGKVKKVESKWDSDHISIYTYKTIIIERTLKNKINQAGIIICDIGGELDGYTTSDAHNLVPNYFEGEDILCFVHYTVSESCDTTYYTYGKRQGKFVLMDD